MLKETKETQNNTALPVTLQQKGQRLDYFDIAKGLAMFCVIAGHMGVTHINAFVFSFHMPLFFLISGHFFKADASKVWRNSKRLIAAYLWTTVAIIVLSECRTLAEVLIKGDDPIMLIKNAGKWVVAGLYGSGSRGDFLGLNIPRIGATWFLLALMWGGTCCLLSTSYEARGNSLRPASHSSLSVGFLRSSLGYRFPFKQACAPRSFSS